ncbi:MAG TPA: metal ABC transporter permease [Streptosporangiaceae bacterium]|jgi:zinc/manganese transport system permease protein
MFAGYLLNTWTAATIAAVVAGAVGFFIVLRGSAFVADAVPQGAFAGAAGASLLGINTLLGVAAFALIGALTIGWLGRRGRHDVATALALVLMLGLGALFLSMSVQYAPEIYSLLFGELFGVGAGQVLPVAVLGAVSVAAIIVMYRPLLLSSVMPGLAEARGVSSFRIELGFLIVVALATSMTLPVVGALLIFSLMIGPPAAARSVTSRPHLALGLSVLIALVTVWLSVGLALTTNWPPGFFVGTLGACSYAAGRGWAAWRRSRRPAPATAMAVT